jgi:hypothetical protein
VEVCYSALRPFRKVCLFVFVSVFFVCGYVVCWICVAARWRANRFTRSWRTRATPQAAAATGRKVVAPGCLACPLLLVWRVLCCSFGAVGLRRRGGWLHTRLRRERVCQFTRTLACSNVYRPFLSTHDPAAVQVVWCCWILICVGVLGV